MTVDQAADLMRLCAEQMNTRYGKVVFDELALVELTGNKGHLLAYIGPRKQGFQRNFTQDAGTLRPALLMSQKAVGDFEFSRHSVGTGFESFMVAGEGVYLIWNNTVQTMDAIARDPLWLGAQVPFVELSDRFRSDPVASARWPVSGGTSQAASPSQTNQT